MFGTIASGVALGLIGAAMVWAGGHHLLAVGLAYALTGMIGALGFASVCAAARVQEHDAGH